MPIKVQRLLIETETKTMEGEEKGSEVLVLGVWQSCYCLRVELALKLKGIPYKYVQQDLRNKSELLLKSNPALKRVPVLVHNGKSIAESSVILEYIDETWNHSPKFLPDDPYHRAKLRFWVDYFDQKIAPACFSIVGSKGEERKKAIESLNEIIRVFEEGIKKDFGEESAFFKGNSMGILEIVVGALFGSYRAFHEAFEIEVIGPNKNSQLYSWVKDLNEHPVMKETMPPHDKLVARLRHTFVRPN